MLRIMRIDQSDDPVHVKHGHAAVGRRARAPDEIPKLRRQVDRGTQLRPRCPVLNRPALEPLFTRRENLERDALRGNHRNTVGHNGRRFYLSVSPDATPEQTAMRVAMFGH